MFIGLSNPGQAMSALRRTRSYLARIGRAFLLVTSLLGTAAVGAWADDSADESRAIDRQVQELLRGSKLAEAKVLAEKGLALCESAGAVKVFCVSLFEESLGDVALGQGQYSEAVAFFEQSLQVRLDGLGPYH